MTDPTNSRDVSDQMDTELARMFDEIHDRLVAGESVDVEAYVNESPGKATTIRQYVATIRAMVSMGEDAAAHGESPDRQSIRTQLGEFSIIREIGRGGMGVVYEAVQADLQRRVALKVLPLASLASDQQIDRFRNEARAVASLHHPHIVSIHSIGREQGVHYFAMQLIDGPSLAEVIRHLQTDQAASYDKHDLPAENLTDPNNAIMASNDVPVRDEQVLVSDTRRDLQAAISTQRSASRKDYFRMIARWGAEAAEALAHAHERGILHRDIKPANLLIDEARHLWISDFGLARLESEQTLSASADIVGTLRYMSPEQATGKRELIDHRSDIYSLGITLYELLALQPAYTGDDRQQLLDRVTTQRPANLRKAEATIPQELEVIIGKATERDREDRYSSAENLSNDLRAFLDDRPIAASPMSLTERSNRWIRHHQRLTAGVTAALVMSVITLTAVTTFVLQQRNRAAAALKESEENFALAEKNFALAEKAVNQLFTRVSDSVLLNQPQMVNLRASLLEDALRFYDKLSPISEDSPEATPQSAIAQVKLGRVLLLLDRRDEAYDALKRGTDRLRIVMRQRPLDEQSQLEMAEGLRALGEASRSQSHNASRSMRERLSEFEQRSRAARKEAIELLRALETSNAEKDLLLSYLYLDDGDSYPKQSEPRRRQHQNAIDAADRAIAISPTPEAKLQRLVSMRQFLNDSDRKDEGRLWEEIIDSAADLVDQHPEVAECGISSHVFMATLRLVVELGKIKIPATSVSQSLRNCTSSFLQCNGTSGD